MRMEMYRKKKDASETFSVVISILKVGAG